MTIDTFFEKFDLFADAPDAVEKMRELVLLLATSGKITKQSENESAAELLSEIREISEFLVKQGKVRKQSFEQIIRAGDEIELPPTWVRCKISNLCDLQTGATPSRQELSYFGGDIPWLVSGDINKREIRDCDGRITELGMNNSNCKMIPANSVLIALNGQGKTRATVALLRISAALNQSLVAMIPYSQDRFLPEYLFWNLRGRYYAIRDITGQDQRRGLNMKLIGSLSIPLPPLAEQKRIVAKVDELMALCDRLEAQREGREERAAALARASLSRFSADPSPANLEFLFHPSYAVSPADLRKAILELAVQGKLVKQEEGDESATALLERISTFKKSQIDLLKGRQGKVSRPLTSVDAPLNMPQGWQWTNIDALCFKVTDGTHFTPRYLDCGIRFVSAKDIVDGRLVFDRCRFISEEEHKVLYRRCNPEFHDIIISKSGTIGAVALIEDHGEFCLFESLALLKYDQENIFPWYFVIALKNACDSLTSGHIRGVGVKHLHLDILRSLELPLPPLAEQKRIVAKVDELMSLVDKLESDIAASQEKAKVLLAAAVAELVR